MGTMTERQIRERITRDNLNARQILSEMKAFKSPLGITRGLFNAREANRLLEEACHRIIRLEDKIATARFYTGRVIDAL